VVERLIELVDDFEARFGSCLGFRPLALQCFEPARPLLILARTFFSQSKLMLILARTFFSQSKLILLLWARTFYGENGLVQPVFEPLENPRLPLEDVS
jgi:hypothetical protein